MKVKSTRGHGPVSLLDAIAAGLAPDGGLYLPPSTPAFFRAEACRPSSLQGCAVELLAPLFQDESRQFDLSGVVKEAFTFEALTRWWSEDTGLLELFHGPTAAFKDFGARFLAAALSRLIPSGETRTVLVATSGDTGAAVAAAFHRRSAFRVVILYPDGRVSPRQAHQLGAFGDNISTFRVNGSFDDCQRLVKQAFASPELVTRHGLTSANSISLGRLLPQMVYYAHAALQARESGRATPSFVIPTGNLGNAFACLMAREYGVPIDRIVSATNANRVLPELLSTGTYKPAESIATLANAMDVGAPSNAERLLARFARVNEAVTADWVDDATIRETIARAPEPICPHTACGVEVLRRLRAQGETGTWIVAATAHPAKFESIVEPLIGRKVSPPPALEALLSRPSSALPLEPTLQALTAALAR